MQSFVHLCKYWRELQIKIKRYFEWISRTKERNTHTHTSLLIEKFGFRFQSNIEIFKKQIESIVLVGGRFHISNVCKSSRTHGSLFHPRYNLNTFADKHNNQNYKLFVYKIHFKHFKLIEHWTHDLSILMQYNSNNRSNKNVAFFKRFSTFTTTKNEVKLC